MKSTTITHAFQENFDESNCKPNKILVDKDSEFIINQGNHGYKMII